MKRVQKEPDEGGKTTSFSWLLVLCLFMGLFDGCFVPLIGLVAYDLCGQNGSAQAIGFPLGLCSIPLTIGPFFAGKMYDTWGSYDIPFKITGVPPIVGALALFFIRLVSRCNGGGQHEGKVPPYDLSNRENGGNSLETVVFRPTKRDQEDK